MASVMACIAMAHIGMTYLGPRRGRDIRARYMLNSYGLSYGLHTGSGVRPFHFAKVLAEPILVITY